MKTEKGFTLIELLMVISIIGLLMAIVLGSLQLNRDRGANAAIKQNLNSIRSQAELYYSTSPTGYVGVCSDAQVVKIRAAADLASGNILTCREATLSWAVSSPLKTSEGSFNYWCVDSTGASRGHSSPLGAVTVCP